MTISSTLNRIPFVCNGITTAFPVSFPFHAQADLIVLEVVIATGVQTVKVNPTHYTISGTTDGLGHYSSGGTINAVAAPAGTVQWVAYRDPERKQAMDLTENNNLPAETVEAQFDYQTMLIQRVADIAGRSLRQPDGDSASIGTLSSKVDRASKFQAYDANGDPISAAGTSANLGPVSSFINTLLDDVDAATARVTLGITAASNADDTFRIVGSADNTKKYSLEVDALTTATTRTRFIANEDSNSAQSWDVMNLNLVASVAANALTIAVKTKNGTDPSATDPIIFKFRNSTLATGDYTTVALTAAMSLVVSSGSTLGTASALPHRLYIGIANDAGTLRLFIHNPFVSATLSLSGIIEDLLYSSTAEGGAGAADSAQVLYSGSAFTSKAVRLVGYLESTQATAGTWATAASTVQLMGPGIHRTGDLIQRKRSAVSAVSTGTTAIPFDDSIPQNTEGYIVLTQAITPSSSINILQIHSKAWLAQSNAANSIVLALIQDSTANALTASGVNGLGVNQVVMVSFEWEMLAATASATTFTARAGNATGATTTFNGSGGARLMGGVANSFLQIEEVFA